MVTYILGTAQKKDEITVKPRQTKGHSYHGKVNRHDGIRRKGDPNWARAAGAL